METSNRHKPIRTFSLGFLLLNSAAGVFGTSEGDGGKVKGRWEFGTLFLYRRHISGRNPYWKETVIHAYEMHASVSRFTSDRISLLYLPTICSNTQKIEIRYYGSVVRPLCKIHRDSFICFLTHFWQTWMEYGLHSNGTLIEWWEKVPAGETQKCILMWCKFPFPFFFFKEIKESHSNEKKATTEIQFLTLSTFLLFLEQLWGVSSSC